MLRLIIIENSTLILDLKRGISMIKEMKKLISQLNEENIDDIKPKLDRYIKLQVLGLDDEKIPDEKLQKMIKLNEVRDELLDEEEDEDYLLIEKFKLMYNEFYNQLIKDKDDKNIENVIQITKAALNSIGGRGRKLRIFTDAKDLSYLKSKQCAEDLKKELFCRMEQVVREKIMDEPFLIIGLIHTIKFYLNEDLQDCSKTIISVLKREKEKEVQSLINQYEFFNKEYVIELERAIYLWDKLTLDMRSHFIINEMYS